MAGADPVSFLSWSFADGIRPDSRSRQGKHLADAGQTVRHGVLSAAPAVPDRRTLTGRKGLPPGIERPGRGAVWAEVRQPARKAQSALDTGAARILYAARPAR
tara:strand:- start:1673 stop:1981 length:309 start_codon:yes stop_codon:yes gene_type:complete